MDITRKKNFKDAIVQTQILDDGTLLVVDSKTTVRYLDRQTLEIINGFKVKIQHQVYKNRVVQFSSDGKFFVAMSADCKESRLYNAKTKKIITKVDRHHGEVSCIGMDTTNTYMFSCGDDGKTFAVDMASGKLAFTLPVHKDRVNDIVFISNANWVATSSYDHTISLFNLNTMTAKHKLKAHSSPIMKMSFIGKKKLFSIDKDNKAIIWDIYTAKVIKRLDGIHDDVRQVVVAENNKFLFLGTALGYILLYELENYEQLSKKYIKVSSEITSLIFDEETKELIISCANGDILFYNIYEGEEHITTLLKAKKYEQIQGHVETNPILEYTKIYSLVVNLWENTLKKIKLSLQKGDKKTAIVLSSYFQNIPSKNLIIQEIMEEYEEYDKFASLAKQGKIVLAYNIVNNHPMYKETPIYKSLESKWQKTFALAQKYSLGSIGVDKAREILAPYRGISHKTKLMQELFSTGEVYIRFKVALGRKDFITTFELIKLHPFLMEFPEYTTMLNYGDSLYIKSHEFIKDEDTHSAIKILRILVDFPDFSFEVKELMMEIEAKQKFFQAIKDEDIALAYNILNMYDDLQNTEDGKRLQQQWEKDFSKANSFAVEGNVASIKEVLHEYFTINSKHRALGSIFGWCYMMQLEQAIEAKKDKTMIEEGIKNYILNFGLQDQILSLYEIFIKKYPNSKLNLELLAYGSLSMWRPSMIVQSILD